MMDMMDIGIGNKILRVFAFAFLGVFLPGIAGVADNIAKGGDWSASRAALIALVFGAIAAAIRAIVAVLPVFRDDNAVGVRRQ